MSDTEGMKDLAVQYAGLDKRVGGIEDNIKTMKAESADLRREMTAQNQGLRHEMTSQNGSILSAIERLTSAASTNSNALRTEWDQKLSQIAERQALKPSVLIGVGGLFIAALGLFITMNNRPMDLRIDAINEKLARHEQEYVPKAQIDRMQAAIDRHDQEIVPLSQHMREWERQKEIDERIIHRIERMDDRLHETELKTAAGK